MCAYLSFRFSFFPLSSLLASPGLQVCSQILSGVSGSLLQRPGRSGLQVQLGPRAGPGTSPLGLSLADNRDHPSDAKSGAIKPGSERHSGPPSAVDHPPAPDKRPGPDHRHGHREPDPASDQHPGHHTLTHQARPAGKGPLSRQPRPPGHLSLPPSTCLVSINGK